MLASNSSGNVPFEDWWSDEFLQELVSIGIARAGIDGREPVSRLYLQRGVARRGRLRHRGGPGAVASGGDDDPGVGYPGLVKVGAIMKQLPSTETLGSTSAINTDKTGTLTLNQMTAVQMTVAGHRYAAEGKGYSTHGRINRVAGQAEIPLDQFLMPMVLASDAVLSDGELIGDPTEGALVVLAAKGAIVMPYRPGRCIRESPSSPSTPSTSSWRRSTR